jgi:hypothetical protein
MANIDDIAKAFVNHYYALFDSNREQLAGLYQNESMLTFQDSKVQGQANIINKLKTLPFTGTIKHVCTSIDAQPTGAGILVFVCGVLTIDDPPKPMNFSQVFHLQPIAGSNGFYVLNDLFRLNLV